MSVSVRVPCRAVRPPVAVGFSLASKTSPVLTSVIHTQETGMLHVAVNSNDLASSRISTRCRRECCGGGLELRVSQDRMGLGSVGCFCSYFWQKALLKHSLTDLSEFENGKMSGFHT